jgi:hypothetical protein
MMLPPMNEWLSNPALTHPHVESMLARANIFGELDDDGVDIVTFHTGSSIKSLIRILEPMK